MFSTFVKISLSYSNCNVEKTDSQYHTAGSQNKFGSRTFLQNKHNVALFSRVRIHIYFCDTVPLKASVKRFKEIDSAQFDTVRSQSRFQNLNQNRIFSTHYSVAQAGSNYEKIGRKSRWNVPLNRIWKGHITSHDSPLYDTVGRLTQRSIILRGD